MPRYLISIDDGGMDHNTGAELDAMLRGAAR